MRPGCSAVHSKFFLGGSAQLPCGNIFTSRSRTLDPAELSRSGDCSCLDFESIFHTAVATRPERSRTTRPNGLSAMELDVQCVVGHGDCVGPR